MATSTTFAIVDPRPIAEGDQTLALAAVLQPESFPAPWVVYAPGQKLSADPQSCAYRPEGALTLVHNGGLQAGPTMELGQTGAFVSSFAAAFPSDTLATEYIGVVNTDTWGECRVFQLQQFQDTGGAKNVVTLVTRDVPTLHQNGFESYAEFHIAGPDGKVNRIVLISFYRLGRTVIAVTQEYGGLADADFKKMTDDAYTALVDAYDRVNAQ